MAQQIELYTQPDCPPCSILKQFLDAHNITYTSYNIKTDKAAKNRLMFEYDSFTTPTIVIDGTVIAGFDLEKIKGIVLKDHTTNH